MLYDEKEYQCAEEEMERISRVDLRFSQGRVEGGIGVGKLYFERKHFFRLNFQPGHDELRSQG